MHRDYDTDHGPNDTNPPTRAYVVLAAVLPFYALTLVMVGSRILIKNKLGKLGPDDVLISISMTLAVGVLICTILSIKYGFGSHVADFRPEWQAPFGKIFYAAVVICSPCVFVTKTSMLCFYFRLAPHAFFRTLCVASITLTTLCWTAIFLVNTFGCKPISGGWNHSPGFASKCVTTPSFIRFSVVCNIGTDILVMLLPIPIIARMQLKIKTKLGLCVMFSMGFLTTAVSAMCLHTVNVALTTTDVTWDGSYTWLWALLELNFGIMTACMPAMMLVWKWIKGEHRNKYDPRPQRGSTFGGGPRKKPPKTGVMGSTSSERMVEEYAMAEVSEDGREGVTV